MLRRRFKNKEYCCLALFRNENAGATLLSTIDLSFIKSTDAGSAGAGDNGLSDFILSVLDLLQVCIDVFLSPIPFL